MAEDARKDWTAGAPKWAAVIVLGAGAMLAIGWAIGRDGAPWGNAKAAVGPTLPQPTPPLPPASTSAPATVPLPAAAPAPEPPRDPPPTPAPSIRKLVNVNTASQAELELLPGIGPAMAKRILDYRAAKGAFKRVEDLDAVKGIGPRTLDRLRPLVTFD